MAVERVVRDYPELITAYLEEAGHVVAAVLDRDGVIETCNELFRAQVAEDDEPLGRPLRDYLGRGDWERLTSARGAPSPSAMAGTFPHRQALVMLRAERHAARPVSLVLFEAGDRLVVFGERVEADESAIVERMSVLTSEMADLNRELTRTNTELERANAKITRLMNSDPLTGIANRRFFSEMLERAVSFAHRHGQPLALTICDVDEFKQLNDGYGHAAGDEVLIAFARLLSDDCRAEDMAARFGGDEFCVLMPATDADRARSFLERVRDRWREVSIEGIDRPVTASFGVAVLRDGEDAAALLKRADEALYAAKRRGRDRIGAA